MIREDLECLLGVLIDGPITPIIYKILKDSPHKDELREILGGRVNASNKSKDATTSEKGNGRVSFAEWLSKNGQSISI